jgi:hypothetical protein
MKIAQLLKEAVARTNQGGGSGKAGPTVFIVVIAIQQSKFCGHVIGPTITLYLPDGLVQTITCKISDFDCYNNENSVFNNPITDFASHP